MSNMIGGVPGLGNQGMLMMNNPYMQGSYPQMDPSSMYGMNMGMGMGLGMPYNQGGGIFKKNFRILFLIWFNLILLRNWYESICWFNGNGSYCFW